MTRRSLRLDARGWEELAEATQAWLREADRVEEAAAQRLARAEYGGDGDGDGNGPRRGLDAGLVVMLFEALPFSEHLPEPVGRGAARRRS